MLIAVIPFGFALPLPVGEGLTKLKPVYLSVHPHYCNVPLEDRQALFLYIIDVPIVGHQASSWSSARVGVCWHTSSCVHMYCSASSMCSRTCSAYSLLLRLVAKSAAINWASAAQLASMMYVSRCSIATRYLTRSSSSTVRAYLPGQTRHTVRCTVSEIGCQIKTSALLTRTAAAIVLWAHVMLSSRPPFDFLNVWET